MSKVTKEQEFIEKSVNILKSRKDKYDKIKDDVIFFLSDILDNEFQGITISGRLKNSEKLAEKIYRKNYYTKYDSPDEFINDLPDGIGIRIVCLMKNEEEKIFEVLRNRLFEKRNIGSVVFQRVVGGKIYINFANQPEKQKNNLEIYRMDALYIEGGEKTRIEIQIKCLTHYFWGELEHSLFYKNYDFTISNNFYANLMKNINSSLENLDYEIELLQKHMARTPENQVTELREIAGLMISKKYENQVEDILGCKVDLREVYAVLVDMHFGLITNTGEALKLLNSLNAKLHSGRDLREKYELINEKKINESMIGQYYLGQVKVLDRNIHSGDVFWRFLYLLFEDMYAEQGDCYSNILQKMAEKICLLYADVMDAADALQESELDMMESVNKVFNLITMNTNKIGYYALEFGMNKIKGAMKKCICHIQNQITTINPNMDDTNLFIQNMQTIQYVIYISVMSELGKIISNTEWNDIIHVLKESTNDYQLSISKDKLEYIKWTNQLENEDFNTLESVLGEEEEYV